MKASFRLKWMAKIQTDFKKIYQITHNDLQVCQDPARSAYATLLLTSQAEKSLCTQSSMKANEQFFWWLRWVTASQEKLCLTVWWPQNKFREYHGPKIELCESLWPKKRFGESRWRKTEIPRVPMAQNSFLWIPKAQKSIWRVLMEPEYTLPSSHIKQHTTLHITAPHSTTQHSWS